MIRTLAFMSLAFCGLPGLASAQAMGMGMGGMGGPPPKPPDELAGIWQRASGDLVRPELTKYGSELSMPTIVYDDPVVRCQGYSVARSLSSGFGVTKIEVGDDFIIIRTEANAGTRKIFLDGKTPSENENINGRSIGELSGGVVTIKTDNFGPTGTNALMANRLPNSGSVYFLSDEFRMLERYAVVDENTLDVVIVHNDPKMLVWPRIVHAQWTRLPDNTPFIQDECVEAEADFASPEDIAKLREERKRQIEEMQQ